MFPEIINSIIKSGLTETDIAQRVGSTQASINRIRNGKQKPSFELGASLIALRDSINETSRA